MYQPNNKKIPRYIWAVAIILLTSSILVEMLLIPEEESGLFWAFNLVTISLFTYYGGIITGIISIFIIVIIHIGMDLQTLQLLTTEELTRTLMVHAIGFFTCLLVGYLAGKIHIAEHEMKEVINNNNITFWTRYLKTGKVMASEGNAKIYGVSRDAFEKNPNLWKDAVHPEDQEILQQGIQKQEKGEQTKITYRIIRPDGTIRWVEDRGTPSINKKGEVFKVNGVILDITAQKEAEMKLYKAAYIDELTGLTNRNWFKSHLEEQLKEATKRAKTCAVMLIDSDHFKRINETFGHQTGDILLKKISQRMQHILPNDHTISRQSGDEFLILLRDTTKSHSEDIAKDIIHKMKAPYLINQTEIYVTPSIGISLYEPGDTSNTNELLEQVEFAMYTAKETGRNNYQFYDQILNNQLKRRLMLETKLRNALYKNELALFYQPKVNITTDQLVGAEALLRWNSDIGNVRPDEFIPIAEETGLITPIGDWVIQEACRHLKRFSINGLPAFPISVNVSTKQLLQRTFGDRLTEIIQQEDVDTRFLTLEITETALLFYEQAKDTIKTIKDLGINISIDDFGVGYSSLSMIKHITMDELKIDQSFLQDALENHRVQSLLQSIILIGKKLQADVVVEGIETYDQLNLLKKHQVHGQGYFYSRPLPVESFEKWCRSFTQNE
ncbi:bifunctional diguanylate cyclase/phosphodiesterase [Oceanobacillus halotolerans]|uniref:bifunctional diguanylate cyclase/phosphodiesterase n=1 Tax=Oceanobacillus halotolerans TaxID=2663380 RepID=UPI001CF79516|nr:GGDEF domain-containing phosphodiesterase [Oceanobacillus halotolerans]